MNSTTGDSLAKRKAAQCVARHLIALILGDHEPMHGAPWVLHLLLQVLLLIDPVAGQKVVAHFPFDHQSVPPQVTSPARRLEVANKLPLPVPDMIPLAEERGGAVWYGSRDGAARMDPKANHPWDRVHYFWGRRWLVDNDVQNVWIDDTSTRLTVWIRTAKGATQLEWRPMTLEEKAHLFHERIEARHVRHGMVGLSYLTNGEDLTTNVLRDDDNDGLWTAMYLGSQCYRYAVTKDPHAKRCADRAAHALMRLESSTGIPGFYARSIKTKDDPPPTTDEWHPIADGSGYWKGDTSSDESVGHYYGYALYYDLVADEEQRESVRNTVARMTDYLIENDYDLIDVTGKPTRWGRWSEAYLQTAEGKSEAPLASLELLSFLKATLHMTGERRFEQAYQDRVQRGYAEFASQYRRHQLTKEVNYSDDELAFLSYSTLLRYEDDPALKSKYLAGFLQTWNQVAEEANPLWNYIAAEHLRNEFSLSRQEDSLRSLQRIPCDLRDWEVRNSHRRDITLQPFRWNGKATLKHVLAPDERPISKWNANPRYADGGGMGNQEDDGAYFLLPYWMGRFHQWIK